MNRKQRLFTALQLADPYIKDIGIQLKGTGYTAWINTSGKPTIKIKHRQKSFEKLIDAIDYVKPHIKLQLEKYTI